jgi:hypothetical protein
MSDNVTPKRGEYDSYAAMDRPAMWWDIPILPGLACFMLGLVVLVAVGTLSTFVWGAICSAPFAIAIIAMRTMTAFDDKFMRRIGFMIARKRLDFMHGRHLFLSPINSQWRQSYGKRNAQQCIIAEQAKSSADEISRR